MLRIEPYLVVLFTHLSRITCRLMLQLVCSLQILSLLGLHLNRSLEQEGKRNTTSMLAVCWTVTTVPQKVATFLSDGDTGEGSWIGMIIWSRARRPWNLNQNELIGVRIITLPSFLQTEWLFQDGTYKTQKESLDMEARMSVRICAWKDWCGFLVHQAWLDSFALVNPNRRQLPREDGIRWDTIVYCIQKYLVLQQTVPEQVSPQFLQELFLWAQQSPVNWICCKAWQVHWSM